MDKFLQGKFAVVTGGTRGIGRAIAESLVDAGADVAICGRSREAVDRAANEMKSRGNVIGHVADVGRPEAVAEFFKFVDGAFGKLNILINNAGVGVFRSVADLTVEDWRTTLETNLSGVFYCCHEAIPRFRKSGGGYVINISSLAGKNPFAAGAAYNASKFGLNGFSEALMLDHRNENIRVSYIMPGSVATEFGAGGGDDWKIAPEDIAELVINLLRMPERTLVSRLEVRPSRPRK